MMQHASLLQLAPGSRSPGARTNRGAGATQRLSPEVLCDQQGASSFAIQ
jgi:hypothetical protein